MHTYKRSFMSDEIFNWNERKNEMNVVEEVEVEAIDLNTFTKKISHKVDFLKIDTEGTEFEILSNFNYFDEIIAIRSEVCFDRLFENIEKDTFSKIHNHLLDHSFVLLNLDYDGRGDYYSRFISSKEKYGILQSTDAIWIKNLNYVVSRSNIVTIIKLIILWFSG